MNDYFSLLKKVFHNGDIVTSRGLKTKELLNQVLYLDTYNTISVEGIRDWQDIQEYLYPELAWYMSGDRDITNILPYSKFWNQIRNADNTANSNYGDLVFYRKNIHGVTSFQWALNRLIEDKSTRKAIVLYNDRSFFFPGNKDLICNQHQNFHIRNNNLHCSVCLRSSDMVYGLTFNMPWWSFVHQTMFLILKDYYPELNLGTITAFLESVHIYENKFELVEKMIENADKQEERFLKLRKLIIPGENFNSYLPKFKEFYVEI